MLLKEYAREKKWPGFGSVSKEPGSLSIIESFQINDKGFFVTLASGSAMSMESLDDMLSCVTDEFAAHSTYNYEVSVHVRAIDPRSPMIKIGSEYPRIEVKNEMGRPWGRNVRRMVEDVRLWTAEFNILGHWNADIPRDASGFQSFRK